MGQWTFRQATWVLVISVTITFTVSFGSYMIYQHNKTKRLTDPRHAIGTLIQTGPEKEALKTTYLAELLGLCVDRPTNLYAVDITKAQKALLASPLIVRAEVERQGSSS